MEEEKIFYLVISYVLYNEFSLFDAWYDCVLVLRLLEGNIIKPRTRRRWRRKRKKGNNNKDRRGLRGRRVEENNNKTTTVTKTTTATKIENLEE